MLSLDHEPSEEVLGGVQRVVDVLLSVVKHATHPHGYVEGSADPYKELVTSNRNLFSDLSVRLAIPPRETDLVTFSNLLSCIQPILPWDRKKASVHFRSMCNTEGWQHVTNSVSLYCSIKKSYLTSWCTICTRYDPQQVCLQSKRPRVELSGSACNFRESSRCISTDGNVCCTLRLGGAYSYPPSHQEGLMAQLDVVPHDTCIETTSTVVSFKTAVYCFPEEKALRIFLYYFSWLKSIIIIVNINYNEKHPSDPRNVFISCNPSWI